MTNLTLHSLKKYLQKPFKKIFRSIPQYYLNIDKMSNPSTAPKLQSKVRKDQSDDDFFDQRDLWEKTGPIIQTSEVRYTDLKSNLNLM